MWLNDQLIWLNVQPTRLHRVTEANRERILQAALTVLSRDGYENTSIKDIAEEAGVAQGLIHYYFKSKQQLVVAALLVCCENIALDQAPIADAAAGFDLMKASLRDNRNFNQVLVQMIGVGLHDNVVSAGVLRYLSSDRGLVEQITRQVLSSHLDLDPRTVRGLAAAIWGAYLGIIVQNLVDPHFDTEGAIDALTQMAAATLTQVTEAG